MTETGAWPAGDGEMARRIREHEWSATALGPIESWPQSLKTAVDLIVPAGFPMIVLWGSGFVQIYNDGYRELMGNKHPAGLGQPTRESWPEVWDINAPICERVRNGETLTFADALYTITRSGKLEDAWFSLSYSPLHDESDAIAGVLVTVFETTDRVRESAARDAADLACRESENRFRAFVTASSDAVYRMSPDWSEMRQLDGRGFIADTTRPSRSWMDLYILAEDLGMVRRAIDEAIAGKRMFELEHRVRRADGGIGWTFSRAVPVVGEQGEIVEWLGTATDVTERRRAEEVLSDTEERQRFLLKFSDTLRPLTDPIEIQKEATRLIGEQLGADQAFYYRTEHDGTGSVHLVDADFHRPGMPRRVGRRRQSDFGVRLFAPLESGKPLAIGDVAALPDSTPEQRANFKAANVRSFVALPLIKGGRHAAGIAVQSAEPRAWTAAEIALIDDVAQRTWSTVERARAAQGLRETEERFRRFGEASTDVLWMRDAESLRWTYLSEGFERIYGLERGKALAGDTMRNWVELIVPEDRAHALACIDRVRKGERATFEYRIRRPADGQVRWMRNTDFPMRDAGGKVIRIGGVGTDITAIKEAEHHQQVLLAELQHRVRNTLAVVRSIARRTAENSTTAEDMLAHFQGRLDSFSRVQAAVTRTADGKVGLKSLIEDELVAHAAREGDQVRIDGPEIFLQAKTAERLSLAVHELTTNAVKHGALAGHAGKVRIRWEKQKFDGTEKLVLEWAESGVEIESDAATEEGFGMELLRRTLPYDLNAETKVDVRPDGLSFSLSLPLDERV